MRRLVVIVLIVAVAGIASSAGTAHAAARWPARCSNFKCVNAHLNALHKQVKAANATLNGFLNCLVVGPITEYTNFLANDNTTSISALDNTHSGDSIDVWLAGFLPGTCGLGTTAAKTGGVPLTHFGIRFR
jgi:hypothetical protein